MDRFWTPSEGTMAFETNCIDVGSPVAIGSSPVVPFNQTAL